MTRVSRAAVALLVGTLAAAEATGLNGYGPGERVLMDAHNAYPERGQWRDRLDRALATGTPLAIEQDLYWSAGANGEPAVVVAHDDDALNGAPALRTYFFERIRPLMEQALHENRRETWPLVVLNLDFKDNQPALLDAVWALLGEYEQWLTTAPRTVTRHTVEPMRVGPLLVLSGADSAQRKRFHDDVPIGGALRVFGAMAPAPVDGDTKEVRALRAMQMSAAQHIPQRADNFARWVNFPWSVVEFGGPQYAQQWTAGDSVRLDLLTRRAHEYGYWIRFYTLDGFAATEDRGWTASYNFGALKSAQQRWRAAISADVDFVATDQYEAFADARDER